MLMKDLLAKLESLQLDVNSCEVIIDTDRGTMADIEIVVATHEYRDGSVTEAADGTDEDPPRPLPLPMLVIRPTKYGEYRRATTF